MYRTTTLAVEALPRLGVDRAAPAHRHRPQHAAREPAGEIRRTASARCSSAAGRSPTAELDALDRESARLQFEVPFSPRERSRRDVRPADDTRRDSTRFLRGYPVNIAAPTDDSPFFFNMLRLRDVVRPELLDFGKLSHNMKAVATLGRPARDRDGLTAVCILLPLWLTRDRVNARRAPDRCSRSSSRSASASC